jgi:hypothetical protein
VYTPAREEEVAKEKFALERYFLNEIPKDVSSVLEIKGIKPLRSGSKFKAAGERGLWTFLYVRKDIVTCFDALGQFRTIPVSKVKRGINRSKREIALEKSS